MSFLDRVYLIGFMGAGKTTIGRHLANKLKFKFIDLDKYIIQKSGMSVPEIFNLHGEAHFRKLEAKALVEVSEIKNAVISLGGGTPIAPDNFEIIKKNAFIYVKLPPKALFQRLTQSKNPRPLLSHLQGDDLMKYISTKLEERSPIYEKATITIDGLRPNLESIIFALESLTNRNLKT